MGHAKNTVRLCRVGDALDLGFGYRIRLRGVLAREAIPRIPLLCRTAIALSCSVRDRVRVNCNGRRGNCDSGAILMVSNP